LLSDQGSVVIRRFGLMNPEYPEGDYAHGVPYPVTFVVDEKGIVRQRFSEDKYQQRRTGASFLLMAGGPPEALLQRHTGTGYRLSVGVSNTQASPGQRLTLVYHFGLDFGHRLCPEGERGCRAPGAALEAGGLATAGPLSAPEISGLGVRLFQDLVLPDRRALAPLLEQPEPRLAVTGTLQVQVCGQKTCNAVESIPLSFTIGVLPPDSVRAPEALQHRSRKP
jgi:hypothetical protein